MSEPTMREYLELRVDAEAKLLREKLALIDKALELQAREYDRRLTELNHAKQTAVEERHRVLPREIFDQFQKDSYLYRDSVTRKLTEIDVQLSVIATRAVTYTTVIGVLLGVASLLLRLWPAAH